MSTKSSEMAFIFSVVLKMFLTSLPLRDTRYMLETVPSDDQNSILQERGMFWEKNKVFICLQGNITGMYSLLPCANFFQSYQSAFRTKANNKARGFLNIH